MMVCTILCSGQNIDSARNNTDRIKLRDSRFIPVKNRSIEIYDVTTPRNEVGKRLFHIPEHIAYDSLLTPTIQQKILAEINKRCDDLGKDTLLTSDLIWVYRPYFDWLFHEDPHYRIEGLIPAKDMRATKRLNVPAFDILCINDTCIINHSLDENFQTGDRIIAINNVEMPEYLRYTYRNRYDTPANIMRYYFFSNVVDIFNIKLERNNQQLEVKTSGINQAQVNLKLLQQRELTSKTYPDSKSGYISIPCFYPNNSRLVKVVHREINKFKQMGLTNVILDLRVNPGGNGDRFDELLSIFINKPVIKYLKGAKVKASRPAMQVYDFISEQMVGQVVNLPEKEVVREFATIPKMYIGGMTYYVLMSKNTGSVAASFCNILQYNGAATLVGEPLLHNANKYGETIPGKMLMPTLLQASAVSIVEYDEYTKAQNGFLMPDITIQYVAADYLSGNDAMLDKLLDMVKHNLVN